jgi:hypothetical protein
LKAFRIWDFGFRVVKSVVELNGYRTGAKRLIYLRDLEAITKERLKRRGHIGLTSCENTAHLRSKGEMKVWTLMIAIPILAQAATVEAKPWRGIEPLHSTRVDFERLVGSKVVRCGNSSCIYDMGEEIVFVLYSTDSTCTIDGATTAWKVPVGTVIEIAVHFKEDKPLSQLRLDLSKFQKVEDEHLPGWIYYVSLEEGLRVEGGLETASGVTYFQGANDNYLRCPSANTTKVPLGL